MGTPDPLSHDEIVRNAAWVRRLAASLTRGYDPDDLVQEAWLALLKAPPPEGASTRSWFAGVARNLALMRRRTEGRRSRREGMAAAGAELEADNAEVLLEERDARQQLGRLLLELDEPFRRTVLLRYEEGLTAAEIARREGIPPGTVRWRLKEGLDRLRAAIEREEGTEGARRRLLLLAFGPGLGSRVRPRGATWLVAGLALPALLGLIGLGLSRQGSPTPHELARTEASLAPPHEAALAPPGMRRKKLAGPHAPAARAVDDSSAIAGAIGGVVVDSNSQRGVNGARLVFARGDESFEVETNADGAFSFVAETPGAHTLISAQAEGYFAFAPEWERSPIVAVARPGRRVEGLSVQLEAAHDYRGLVIGPKGEPVAGAQIRLIEPPSRERAPDPLPERYQADRAGAFWFRAPEGSTLEATGPGYGSGQTLIDQGVASSRELTLRLPRGNAGAAPRREALAGSVIDEAGEPVAGALVRGEPEDGEGMTPSPTLTDTAGRFVFPALAAGSYRLLVTRGGGVPRTFAGHRTGEADAKLVLRRGGVIEGRVVRATSGEPVPSFTLFLNEPTGLGRHPVDMRAVVDPEGRFRFDDVLEGPYRLLALAAGFGASAEWPLHVNASTPLEPIDLSLPDGEILRGRVVSAEDGQPIESAWVGVYRPALSGHDILPPSLMALTDAEGAFTLPGVEPGLRSIMVGAAGRHRRLRSGLLIEEGTEIAPTPVSLSAIGPGEARGTYLGGFGAIYQPSEVSMKIVSVWPGGGAAEAGLVPGDEIMALDGVSVVEFGADEFLERTRAPEQGVSARLLVRRAGKDPPLEIVVPRRLTRRLQRELRLKADLFARIELGRQAYVDLQLGAGSKGDRLAFGRVVNIGVEPHRILAGPQLLDVDEPALVGDKALLAGQRGRMDRDDRIAERLVRHQIGDEEGHLAERVGAGEGETFRRRGRSIRRTGRRGEPARARFALVRRCRFGRLVNRDELGGPLFENGHLGHQARCILGHDRRRGGRARWLGVDAAREPHGTDGDRNLSVAEVHGLSQTHAPCQARARCVRPIVSERTSTKPRE